MESRETSLPNAAADPGTIEYDSWQETLRSSATGSRARATERPVDAGRGGAATPASLYERLGRRDGIARITRTLIANHLANPVVGARYASSDLEKVERRVVEFFCAGAGGPEVYTGRDILSTHKGMNISEQEFVAVIDDAMAALEANDVDATTRNEVLGILWSLKREVIRV